MDDSLIVNNVYDGQVLLVEVIQADLLGMESIPGVGKYVIRESTTSLDDRDIVVGFRLYDVQAGHPDMNNLRQFYHWPVWEIVTVEA